MSSYSLCVRPIEEYTSAVIVGIRRSISAAGLLLLGLCTACGPRVSVDGHWLGNAGLKPSPGADPRVINTMGRVELWVKDGTFKMSESGIPLDGTVRTSNGKAYLEVTGRFGRPISQSPKEIVYAYTDMTLERRDGAVYFNHPSMFASPIKLESQPNP